jgi:ribonuclease Y
MTTDEAKSVLLERVRQDVSHDAAMIVREAEQRAREEADRKARNIIGIAIGRVAADHTAESTVSVVHIPSDDLKGRIIGREGRNIRAFEQLTGINLIIDDTPEAVILSSFDSVRREVGRITLENLIADGRIHPARIEEMFKKAEQLVEQQVFEAGEQAVFDTGVHNLHHDLVRTLGRLRYRTSYGQNVLNHSLEVAYSTTSGRPSITRSRGRTRSSAPISPAGSERTKRSSTASRHTTATWSRRPWRP